MTRSVYVAQSANGSIKIGISTCAARRMHSLSQETKQAIVLKYCGDCDGPAIEAIEKQAHALLDAWRVKGEWFSISASEAIEAVMMAAAQLGYVLRKSEGERVYSYSSYGRVGRPPAHATPILVRIPGHQLNYLDAWRARQSDKPGRPEAIRRLLDQALRNE